MRFATGPHHPLDRLGLLLYISLERLPVQSLALNHLAGADILGNLINGLGQIDGNTFHNGSPNVQSPPVFGIERWAREESIKSRSLRSLGRAKARPLTKRYMNIYNG